MTEEMGNLPLCTGTRGPARCTRWAPSRPSGPGALAPARPAEEGSEPLPCLYPGFARAGQALGSLKSVKGRA